MGHAGAAAAAVRYLGPGPVEPPARPRLRCVPADERTSEDGRAPVEERAPVDPAEFRRVLGNFASGVTVVTAPATRETRGGPGPAGFACQSFASLSLDPPLVCFMVGRASTTWPRIARAGVFCVNVLGAGQDELCRAFAVSGADKFAGVAHDPAPVSGAPRLAGAVAWIDCAVHAVHTGGDHLIVVGRVTALGTDGTDRPLLFHRGRFARLADD
ncbi:flavin reductase family protein [Streptomyces sp. CSDS2]|uniref:flavin reductase family protein n=1 Tax=Streptomyces sp. CSDS2 TaxID=3055051 RepID=UPI0025AFBEF5|nr:flavin reductase family protein [Streptomyces sp. CSDS2]MDN3263694.1 flavin reductase family protein [Streptomyces sp. CSDS2]